MDPGLAKGSVRELPAVSVGRVPEDEPGGFGGDDGGLQQGRFPRAERRAGSADVPGSEG